MLRELAIGILGAAIWDGVKANRRAMSTFVMQAFLMAGTACFVAAEWLRQNGGLLSLS